MFADNFMKMDSLNIEYILAHGSSNLFVMIDTIRCSFDMEPRSRVVEQICRSFNSDGLLFVEQHSSGCYAMNMYNTDGSQAEMCGNGMRIVARLVDERYTHSESFTLYSGGKPYPITRAKADLDGLIPNYGVDIDIHYSTADFTPSTEPFIGKVIEELHPTLEFTYLNLGNPHIVTLVERVDLDLLSQLGERVKELKEIFPNGVNVSMMEHISKSEIFVSTFERGVGLTPSCGTAMTASSTTAALLGLCDWGASIRVSNRGGFVHCIPSKSEGGALTTKLIGNATYLERGEIREGLEIQPIERFENEQDGWESLLKSLL